MKKRVLVVYPEMMVGGSTTALLSFLNCIDKEKYEIDLQLYKNIGPLLNDIPEGINLLPEAFMYNGKLGSLFKKIKFVLTGTVIKARKENKKIGKDGYALQAMSDFQAKHLSRKTTKRYDIAIGFLENWADRYIAYQVVADKKIGWMHSTFKNIASIPELEWEWMRKVDNVVFVADNCTEDFKSEAPEFADKAVTIRNIVDSDILKKRAEAKDVSDIEFKKFCKADCFKIITVCRVDINTKGLDRAVLCAKKLKENGTKFLWMIIGDGPDFEETKALIEQNGLAEEMVMIGSRLNPLPFVKEADLFCMLSRYEGKPMVITESMIMGTPPFVTRYLSADEQIENGVDGIVVDNGDDTAFEVLKDYIENPTEFEKIIETLNLREYGNAEYMKEIEQEHLK